jgi:hypothetical protein
MLNRMQREDIERMAETEGSVCEKRNSEVKAAMDRKQEKIKDKITEA